MYISRAVPCRSGEWVITTYFDYFLGYILPFVGKGACCLGSRGPGFVVVVACWTGRKADEETELDEIGLNKITKETQY
jgi:hypothetical protein